MFCVTYKLGINENGSLNNLMPKWCSERRHVSCFVRKLSLSRPTTQATGKDLKKFDGTESDTVVARPHRRLHHRSPVSPQMSFLIDRNDNLLFI